MEEEKKEKTITLPWYFRIWVIVIAILGFGPLGLPLLWFRPNTKFYLKLVITIFVIIVTLWMSREVAKSYRHIVDYYTELSKM